MALKLDGQNAAIISEREHPYPRGDAGFWRLTVNNKASCMNKIDGHTWTYNRRKGGKSKQIHR